MKDKDKEAEEKLLIESLLDSFGQSGREEFAFTLHDIAAMDFSLLVKMNDAMQFKKNDLQRSNSVDAERLERQKAEFLAARRILYECQISSSRKGFLYLCECFLVISEFNRQFFLITKDLYPVVAKRCNTSASVIESSIRACITATWENADLPDMGIRQYFDKKPSNLKFIREICRRANFMYFAGKIEDPAEK